MLWWFIISKTENTAALPILIHQTSPHQLESHGQPVKKHFSCKSANFWRQLAAPFNSHLHLPSSHPPSATLQFFSAVNVYTRGNSNISDSESNHMSLQKLTLHPFPSLTFTPDANQSVWLSSECPKDRISLQHKDWDLFGTSQSAFIIVAFKSPYLQTNKSCQILFELTSSRYLYFENMSMLNVSRVLR
jgi:hypothetical protein